jgi:hypothetical protein
MHQPERCPLYFNRAAHPYLNIEVDEVDAEEAREARGSPRGDMEGTGTSE